jgi:hypothetical protein
MSKIPDFAEHMFTIPIELIENLIIPYSALAWLSVCKKYNALAINYAVDDPYLLADPKRAVFGATYHKNYALLNVLLVDRRYTAPFILSQIINICSADKMANMTFLKYCNKWPWMTSRILYRAVRSKWIDVVEYTLNNAEIVEVDMDSFGSMSQEIFELVIHHPKLKWADRNVYDVALNTSIPDNVKMKILELPNINLSAVLEKFDHVEVFVDALAEHPRVIDSTALQRELWAKVATSNVFYDKPVQYDKIQMVKKILAKKILDPSIDDNYPLRMVLKENDFDPTSQIIAGMLLDDDRVTLTLEPFTENLFYSAITSHGPLGLTKKINFLLNHHKCKKEWLEEVIKFIFDEQSELDTIDNTEKIFEEHNFDEYLSKETRERAPREIKGLKRLHAYYYNYYGDPNFYLDDEENN